MGLYESELNKQMILRNKQRREWELMNKKILADEENKKQEHSHKQRLLDEEKKEEDRAEIAETEKSKKLNNAMVKSSQDDDSDNETLSKAVDVLKDQHGNILTAVLAAAVVAFFLVKKINIQMS